MKYYAVRSGRQPGIFKSWAECQEQTRGYSGAAFKSFESLEEAQAYLQEAPADPPIEEGLPFAYIDGSYNQAAGVYSWGGFLSIGGEITILQGTGSRPEYLQRRNEAGELIGALQVLFECVRRKVPEIVLYHDYTGTGAYITGSWAAKNPLAAYYRNTFDLLADNVTVHFAGIRGHAGIAGNELADALAKQAAGVHITKKAEKAIEALRNSQ